MKQFISAIAIFLSAIIFAPHNANAVSPALIQRDHLTVHFLDVGQGDGILAVLPDGKSVLIDTGDSTAGGAIAQHMKSLGIKRISHLIFTHPHDDHIGGIADIASEIPIDTFHDNGFNNFNSPVFEDYIKLVRGDPQRYRILKAGDSLVLGSVTIMVLNPLLPSAGDLNEDSVVLKIVFGGIHILLSGDLGSQGEERLMASGTALTSQVLKVGHHGDRDACSEAFLKRVRPEAAIISVHEGNRYGQPHRETLDRLKNAGAKIYRTDRDGRISLKTDGVAYSIHTEKTH